MIRRNPDVIPDHVVIKRALSPTEDHPEGASLFLVFLEMGAITALMTQDYEAAIRASEEARQVFGISGPVVDEVIRPDDESAFAG